MQKTCTNENHNKSLRQFANIIFTEKTSLRYFSFPIPHNAFYKF